MKSKQYHKRIIGSNHLITVAILQPPSTWHLCRKHDSILTFTLMIFNIRISFNLVVFSFSFFLYFFFTFLHYLLSIFLFFFHFIIFFFWLSNEGARSDFFSLYPWFVVYLSNELACTPFLWSGKCIQMSHQIFIDNLDCHTVFTSLI